MKTYRSAEESGFALIISLVIIMLIASLAGSLVTVSLSELQLADKNFKKFRANALAEAGADAATQLALAALADLNPVTNPETEQGEITVGKSTVTYSIQRIGNERLEKDAAGVVSQMQAYEIRASARFGEYPSTVIKVVDVARIPIFQYAVFYNGDLEMLPGPSMTLSGRVHTNKDLYIGCNDTLTINSDYLRSVGNIYRRRKDDGTPTGGKVNMKIFGSEFFETMQSRQQLREAGVPDEFNLSGFDSSFHGFDANENGSLMDSGDIPNWTTGSQELWGGSVQSAEHGVEKALTPTVGDIQAFVEMESGTGGDYEFIDGQFEEVDAGTGTHNRGPYHENADLVILDGKAYNASGSDITSKLPDGTITESKFYDAREGKMVTVTDVDVGLLSGSKYYPENGLLYAAKTGASTDQPDGIRFKNAAYFPNGLTIVSQNPVYTLGDFNTGDYEYSDANAGHGNDLPIGTDEDNTGDSTGISDSSLDARGIHAPQKEPVAIITDALNILSNAWNDTKSAGTLPAAKETTVNCAFITGGYETNTDGKGYNGGFENLPRFHENWSGVSCNIKGSFVNIWDSQFGQGEWVYGKDRYQAPIRNWDYDLDFNDFDKLPPFTPMVVMVVRTVWEEY